MSGNTFYVPTQRRGVVLGEILAYAEPVTVLGIFGANKRCPKNEGETIKYRRFIPTGGATTNANTINRWSVTATDYELQEGVTPDAQALTPQDISVTMAQYGVLFSHTDKVADLHEDDMPKEQRMRVGELMGLVLEMVRYGVVKGGTNKFYGGTGTTRLTVNSTISLNGLRRIARNLNANHAKRITSILAPSASFNTSPVEAGYIVVHHTDVSSDVRDLDGFIPVANYGSRKPISPHEIGSVEEFRFIASPELAAYADAATSVTASSATPPLYSTTGTNPDVYPVLVFGQEAWGQLAMRFNGNDAPLDYTYLPVGTKDKTDPLGQRGYVGAKAWFNCVLLNQGWMAVYEVGISSLTS